MSSPEQSKDETLTPEQIKARNDLLAILRAYDVAPDEVQEEMRAAVRGENPGYQVPPEVMRDGYAAEAMAQAREEVGADASRDVVAEDFRQLKRRSGPLGLIDILAERGRRLLGHSKPAQETPVAQGRRRATKAA